MQNLFKLDVVNLLSEPAGIPITVYYMIKVLFYFILP